MLCADGKLLIREQELSARNRNMTNRFRSSTKSLCAALCAVLVAQLIAPAASAQTPPARLNIVIVRGDGAVNDARHHMATIPVVRIEDEQHKPVANASVSFTLPTEGASGEFAKHSRTLTVLTDREGEAEAKDLHMNQVPGKVPILINVSYRGLMASGSMMEYNVVPGGAKAHHGHGALVAVLLILGGAAAGGAYYELRSKKGASSGTGATGPAAIGISPGTGSIGTPY